MEFTYFDMGVIGITVILGLKGLFRGFIKEVFGIVGIIGGIFLASRFAKEVGDILASVLALENEATIKLIGFIAILIGFWLIVYLLGTILNKISDLSGLGVVNRTLGFLFGSAKIFLIFSVITYALYQVQSFKSYIDKNLGQAVVFPYLIKTGGYIIKLDTTKVTKSIENGVDSVVNSTKETFNKEVENIVEEKAKEAAKKFTSEEAKQEDKENTENTKKEGL